MWIVISLFGNVDSDAGLHLQGLTWRECSTCARCCKGYWLSVSITYPQSLFMIDAIVNHRITGTGARTSRCCTPSGGSFAACENSWTPMGCSSTLTWSGCLASLAGPRFCRLHPEWVMSWHKLPGLFVQRAPISYYTEVEAVCAVFWNNSLFRRWKPFYGIFFVWLQSCFGTGDNIVRKSIDQAGKMSLTLNVTQWGDKHLLLLFTFFCLLSYRTGLKHFFFKSN